MILAKPFAALAAALLCVPQPQPDAVKGVDLLIQQSEALSPLVSSDLARDFLAQVPHLPRIEPRTLYQDSGTKIWYRGPGTGEWTVDQREAAPKRECDENFYYQTGYGSPLVYVRILDLLARDGLIESLEGKRVLDFGYGSIGQMRLMAQLGANAVGSEVSPVLHALYSYPGDQGPITPTTRTVTSSPGHITLIDGQWPAAEPARAAAGTGFDLITSKNTLKNGYINPSKPTDERRLVKLGVTNDEFVRATFEALNPGGLFVIYNICPAPEKGGEDYIPWADGRSPFSRDSLERAGFEVIAFDSKDDATSRRYFKALGYTEPGKSLDDTVFTWYTIARKPAAEAS